MFEGFIIRDKLAFSRNYGQEYRTDVIDENYITYFGSNVLEVEANLVSSVDVCKNVTITNRSKSKFWRLAL